MSVVDFFGSLFGGNDASDVVGLDMGEEVKRLYYVFLTGNRGEIGSLSRGSMDQALLSYSEVTGKGDVLCLSDRKKFNRGLMVVSYGLYFYCRSMIESRCVLEDREDVYGREFVDSFSNVYILTCDEFAQLVGEYKVMLGKLHERLVLRSQRVLEELGRL